MILHPLQSEDIHAIQDYLVTKITLLLSVTADDAQWQNQYDAQEAIDPHLWASRNAFLWDYTLARFIAAVHIKRYQVLEHASPEEQFLEEFVQAVAVGDHRSAGGLWDGMNEFSGAASTVGTNRPLTRRLREIAPTTDLVTVMRTLPPALPHRHSHTPQERTS
jgi:hypothetical protein